MIQKIEKARYFVFGLFLFLISQTHAQDQRVADSLELIYKANSLLGEEKLQLLDELAFNSLTNPERAIQYADELIENAEREGNGYYLFQGYFSKGNAFRLNGKLEPSLSAYFTGVEIAQQEDNVNHEGSAYGAIADVYSISNDTKNAMRYYRKAVETLKKGNDSISLASYMMNAGDELMKIESFDSALIYFEDSGEIFESLDYLIGKAYNLGNIGMVYAQKGENDLAEQNLNSAIEILESYEDYYGISAYLLYVADIYIDNEEEPRAIQYARRSFDLSKEYGLIEQVADASLKLSELYEKSGNTLNSFNYYKDHIKYRDSLNNIETVQKLANQRADFEVDQKQLEVDFQRKNKEIIAISTSIVIFFVVLGLFGVYKRYKFVRNTNKIIALEKDKSDALLLNILPEETAHELKVNGRVEATKIKSATVLFTDFQGFTRMSTYVEPEKLVRNLDNYFKAFDEITEKFGLEKIKTIGDAYMCAGGLPTINETHAQDVVKAAIEMVRWVEQINHSENEDILHFGVRVGINTGPVIAGIVGSKKWQYDIWGDTVNIASRMESNSKIGRINISESTKNLIGDEYTCEYRGEIEVKNRGKLKMYFLDV